MLFYNMHQIETAKGMDVIIISSNSSSQSLFWQERLKKSAPYFLDPSTIILSITEDWKNGAGNGLGTLYAYQKASLELEKTKGISLFDMQQKGASIAIYHTAGKGSRLAPLTCSESNNKSAVKLASNFFDKEPMTLLEAVIKQTKIYHSKGRCFVFWGDQIFLPEYLPKKEKNAPVEIFIKKGLIPSQKLWSEMGLHNYGLVTLDKNDQATQVEKIHYQTFIQLLKQKELSVDGGLGLSLGIFSLSFEMVYQLVVEFEKELREKTIKLDTDPDFWMALSLSKSCYLSLLGEDKEKQFERMQIFKNKLFTENIIDEKNLSPIGAIDIGLKSYWWDYGTTQNYHKNHLKLLQESDEANCMRQFFGIEESDFFSSHNQKRSLILNSTIKEKNRLENSVICDVHCQTLNISDSVVIKTKADEIEGEKTLIYQVKEKECLKLKEGQIIADCPKASIAEDEGNLDRSKKLSIRLKSNLNRDGKEDWEKKIEDNPTSYAELYSKIS